MQEIVVNKGNFAILNTNREKLLLFNYKTQPFVYENTDAYDDDLEAGTVFGRISATGKVVPLTSGASNGSQFPVGILIGNITIEGGEEKTLHLAVSGDIAESQIKLQGSDTLSTVISGKQIRDRISSDTVGIRIVDADELTNYDNS